MFGVKLFNRPPNLIVADQLIMQERPGIRILQISGRLASQFIGRNLSLAFLHKPFLPAALIEKIREVLTAPAGTRRAISEPDDFPMPAVASDA